MKEDYKFVGFLGGVFNSVTQTFTPSVEVGDYALVRQQYFVNYAVNEPIPVLTQACERQLDTQEQIELQAFLSITNTR